jgi:hypothetical protein
MNGIIDNREATKERYKINALVHALTPLMVAVGGRRHAADEQHDTNPPFGVFDALGHFTSRFWPPSNIQCL